MSSAALEQRKAKASAWFESLRDRVCEACETIAKEVDPALTLSALDVGKTLRVVVTATNAAGSTAATSKIRRC